jgi:acyl carrier protein
MSDKVLLTQQPLPQVSTDLQTEIARLIVQALSLPVAPSEIDPRAPLYGEGLGLDSIDILEVALVVAKRYGVELRADGEGNEQIFRSLEHLANYIAVQIAK